jgi:hypothetical protein
MAQKTTVMKLTAWYINKFNNINTDQLLIYLYIMVIALDMHLEKVKYMHINLPITNVYCFFQNMYISKLYNSAWTEADSKTDSSILTCVVHFQIVWCSTDWHWQQNKQLYSYLCGTFPSCMMQHGLTLTAKQTALFLPVWYISKLYDAARTETGSKTILLQLCFYLCGPIKTPIQSSLTMQ